MIDLAYQRHTLRVGQAERPYALYAPPHSSGALILFLHGKGERGSDGRAPTRVGLGPAIARHPLRFPCLVAFPQCPPDRRWTESLELVDRTWEAVAARYPVNPARVIVTGISMGGFGAWAYAAQRASRLCALVPICGGGLEERAPSLAGLPIWAFHGARDAVVSVEQTRRMVRAVRRAGGQPHFTEYANEGHACWDRAYGAAETIAWMLAQHRGRAALTS